MTVRRVILRGALLLSAVALLAQGGDPARPKRELDRARQSAREAGRRLDTVESRASKVATTLEGRRSRAARLDAILADLDHRQRLLATEMAVIRHRRDSLDGVRRLLLSDYAQVARALLKQQLMTPAASVLLLPSEHRRLALKQRIFERYAGRQRVRAGRIGSASRFLALQDSVLHQREREQSELVDARRNEIIALLEQQGTDSASLEETRMLRRTLQSIIERKNREADEISAMIGRLARSARSRTKPTERSSVRSRRRDSLAAPRFAWPVSGRQIVRGYGRVRNAETGTVTLNPGIDIASARGAVVRSAEGGRVSLVSWLPGYATIVIVEHPDGYRTVYGNLQSVSVSSGARVEPGEALGNVGDSHEGAFLHFEVWKNQTRLDPAGVMK